jgi:hypothetical protein
MTHISFILDHEFIRNPVKSGVYFNIIKDLRV